MLKPPENIQDFKLNGILSLTKSQTAISLPHAVGPAAHEVRGAIVPIGESRDVRQPFQGERMNRMLISRLS